MEFIDEKLLTYIENHSDDEDDILFELNRETHAKVLHPRMLSGHIQGRYLAMISHLIRPTTILEIGTYTGYSAICLSEGLQPHGKLITIDINDELSEMVNSYFVKAGIQNKIEHIAGDASIEIPKLNFNFDLVFIDADKNNYAKYYDLVFEKVNIGGVIIVDNVLWSGHILEEEKEMDESTLSIYNFNKKIKEDKRVSKVLLPLRDGLFMIRKISA
jgi:predicted O-methyltransferase YrrM